MFLGLFTLALITGNTIRMKTRIFISEGHLIDSGIMSDIFNAIIRTVCIGINPAVVTKLADRGSGQTIGIISDVGLFLRALADKLGVSY